jgi:hypothetical protein
MDLKHCQASASLAMTDRLRRRQNVFVKTFAKRLERRPVPFLVAAQ